MAIKQVSLGTLEQLGFGLIGVQFQKLLHQAAEDCVNRPGMKATRKLSFTVELKPVVVDGKCEDVSLLPRFALKIPAHETREYHMGVRRDSKGKFSLLVNDESPDNIRQGTLDEVLENDQE